MRRNPQNKTARKPAAKRAKPAKDKATTALIRVRWPAGSTAITDVIGMRGDGYEMMEIIEVMHE